MDLNQSLQQTFGFDQFREGQESVVQQLLDGHSSLAIFPTGAGKSLCYQFTALHLPNLTLVVSPLLALMKDQLAFLKEKGIAAASIDSTLTPDENRQVMADIRSGKIKILMISVERFKNERFREFIRSVPVSMLVVDEAHCISEWGHNFRPDYLKLPSYRNELNIPLVLLLTATATRKVKRDMAERFAIKPESVVQTGFYRSNLDIRVLPVADKNRDQLLLSQIMQQSTSEVNPVSGIVYVTLQQTAEQVAGFLQQQGVHAVAYHAGLDNDLRRKIQNDFMSGTTPVVVATIAFGMGIDKSDVRFVIHYDLPKSIENYSQEIGRAGRDGNLSRCITLASLDGINTVENFIYGDTPEPSAIEYVLKSILEEQSDSQWELQINTLANSANIRQLPLKTLLVQLELMGVITPLYSYFADFKYKFVVDKDAVLNRFQGERSAFIEAIIQHTDFKRVWGTLDFESLYQQYGCDRQRVVAAMDYLHEENLIVLETKKITEVFSVNTQALNLADLAERLNHYFQDKESKEVERIATLVRFFELERCLTANLARYFDDRDAPERCGHCSACRGEVAKLSYSSSPQLPDDNQLTEYLRELNQLMEAKSVEPTVGIQCRFLLGISMPLFTRLKARQLAGFASCEQVRFSAVKTKLEQLSGISQA
ncbi:RecQ family ATP-dependent DNA helicase [Neptuniibacter caesariensis]|uniref:ATP-dependent DNA helicase RecQ n=1 Tax=Neptuniibacter caesariensis TaxID=207954 RepID=A0A7U8C4V5_NEPCE|nr:ATP-dependent DNA helicase RecQ [Neptuniibacter caesariensis]EAR61608.1 RecQ domain protein [Oceanospirillum sp. MED92] [Neptuniibacter caesariensis]